MATAGASRGSGPERAWVAHLPMQGVVTLDAEESAHLVRVRRVAAGDEVVLFDSTGLTRRARLRTADARAACLEVLAEAPDRRPARALVVASSIPEPSRADDLVEGLAWLGVERWVPLRCARTPAGREDLPARRAARWERVAREAAKGNGCARMLRVEPVRDLAALVDGLPPCGAVLLDPDPQAPRLLGWLGQRAPGADLPWLLVGPEGGFVDAEVARAREAGVPTVQLGATALRVEQAALAAAAQTLGLA